MEAAVIGDRQLVAATFRLTSGDEVPAIGIQKVKPDSVASAHRHPTGIQVCPLSRVRHSRAALFALPVASHTLDSSAMSAVIRPADRGSEGGVGRRHRKDRPWLDCDNVCSKNRRRYSDDDDSA